MRSNTQTESEFTMRAAGQTVRATPDVPSPEERLLRAKLVIEEAFELLEALAISIYDFTGSRIDLKGDRDEDRRAATGVCYMGDIELAADEDASRTVDWLEAVDACCDLNYVVAGTMSCLGAEDVEHQAEVNRANRQKFPADGKAYIDRDGKYRKPEGWKPPNHLGVLAALGVDVESLADECVL